MQCSKHHQELNENGEGKCSVPMWCNGMPSGFCDKTAYGEPPKSGRISINGQWTRADGRYAGYVPALACPDHGGPEFRRHYGDPCKYCGTMHDEVARGACPGKPKTKSEHMPDLHNQVKVLREALIAIATADPHDRTFSELQSVAHLALEQV